MNAFTNQTAKEAAHAEAVKRNKHKSKHLSHMTWKPLWNSVKGWHVELRPTVEVERKGVHNDQLHA